MKDKRNRIEYRKKYWAENKEQLKPKRREYWKRYSETNREKLREKAKKYYYENIDKMKAYQEKNRDRIRKRHQEYYKKHRIKIRKQSNAYLRNKYRANLSSWIDIIPKQTQCEICGKKIYFNKLNRQEAIHFDHRNNGIEEIKTTPATWLFRHNRTADNEAIWNKCNFGMLCGRCNSILPTKNRKEFIKKIINYIGGL